MIDLTEDSPSQQSVATNPKQQPPWLLIAIIAIAGWLYFSRQQSSPDPNPDDQSVIVDDESQPNPQPSPTPVDLRGATLVFVLENIAPSDQQTEVMLSVTTESLKARGMAGFRRYDEEQSEAQSLVELAVSKNTPSPFVALVRDKQCLRLASFPKSKAELEAFLR
jgi:hypothetical protein